MNKYQNPSQGYSTISYSAQSRSIITPNQKNKAGPNMQIEQLCKFSKGCKNFAAPYVFILQFNRFIPIIFS